MTNRDSIVQLYDVSKRFGQYPAVEGVSLKVERGHILTVLGPSGCGKTTLLRLIAGFEIPDQGEIIIEGRPVAAPGLFIPAETRRVGMVFQHHALFPHLTVEENIAFGISELDKKARLDRVQHLLNLIALPQLHSRYPHELSGGQQQRISLARALAPKPAVVLMDEPFSDLDTDQRLRLRDQVRVILKQAQTTVVFVTHDQEEALFMGDDMAIMRHGRVEQEGNPEAVFSSPASTFIAEFLGQTEFLPATVVDGGLSTELGFLKQKLDLAEGEQVQVGFRSDDLEFATDPDGGSMVLARYFRGPVCLYRIRLGSGRLVHSMQPHFRTHKPGTAVRVWFEPHHVLPLFRDGQAVPTERTESDPQRVVASAD